MVFDGVVIYLTFYSGLIVQNANPYYHLSQDCTSKNLIFYYLGRTVA